MDECWHPLLPRDVATLLRGATFPWWIAGGHAVDHFVGRTLRPHGDIDVLLLRADQAAARAMLAGWNCWAADPPGTLRPWEVGESLPAHVSDVWCRQTPASSWSLQLMLDDGDHEHWRSRRNPAVTKPLAELGARGEDGIAYLAIEVQLFYKAKAPRPKDELDFAAALPLLAESQRAWLEAAVETAYGASNPWFSQVRGADQARESRR